MLRSAMFSLCMVLLASCTTPKDTVLGAEKSVPPPLTVMTYNIRNGKANDGENNWENRKALCASRITHFNPDIVGLQEAYDFQNDYLLATCPGYTAVGVGRDGGKNAGEFSTLFLRTNRFTIEKSGTFWLSETPDVPGSKSWDSSLPRIATWARVHDQLANKKPLLIINTHFDHRGKEARKEAAKVIRSFIIKNRDDAGIIVLGDFNSAPDSPQYHSLVDAGPDYVALQDAYRVMHPDESKDNAGTFHGFSGTAKSARIDWILHGPHWRTTQAIVDRHHIDARYPSDHFPVIAVLAYQ